MKRRAAPSQPSSRPSWIRRRRVIKPGLQAWLIGSFFAISLLALLVQFLLFGFLLMRVANRMPSAGELLVDALPGLLLTALGGSLLVLLPATLLIGIAITFRVAGPVYRFEMYLSQVARGEDPGPCRIRKGDRFQDLCERINEAIETLRGRAGIHDPEHGRDVTVEEPPSEAA